MIKKMIAVMLALTGILVMAPCSFAQEVQPKLYTFYGDGMLFKQNEDAVISGTGKIGCVITSELYNSENSLVASGKTDVKSDGTFAVAFTAPSGGYDEYKIVLKADGKEFATLNNVVFGELWLASGQSNMQYPLAQAKGGRDMFAKGEKLDKNLRVLLVPGIPEYKGSNELVPADPQTDIPGAKWVTGENGEVYSMSAVAYYFAEEMLKELDMPVGILNIPLGGTSIAAWLSREAIDSDSLVKNDLVSDGTYIEKSAWNEKEVNVYHAMTTNYNLKVEALRHFRLSGMVWYQGETDLMFGWSGERYARAFDLMQRSYTELFEYENGLLPIVYTQLAAFNYSDNGLNLADMNIAFADIQKQRPESRAVVSISDVPITYLPEVGVIHPESKEEVGDRMAFAAKGLVYGKYDDYTAAAVKSSEIKDGSVYVTLDNVGDGIAASGSTLYGFAVCGKDGVYVQANAEIINADTVRVWSESVPNPCSASYAYCVNNQRANLYSTRGGELIMPAGPFVTDKTVGTHYFIDKIWADCDDAKIWHTENDEFSMFYDSWSAESASVSVSAENAYGGSGGLSVKAEAKSFSVSPVLTCKKNGKTEQFFDSDADYSGYGKVSFYVRNNGNADVTFEGMKLYKSSLTWYAPAVEGTNEPQTVIPADGEWHCVTLDLNSLYLFGNECGITYPNDKLDEVKSIKLCFSSDGEADVSLDQIRFAPSTENVGMRFNADIKNADNFAEIISAMFVTVIGLFANLFI